MPDPAQPVYVEVVVVLAQPDRTDGDVVIHGESVAQFQTSSKGASGHACNCIGCCRICGGCRTAPWHVAICDLTARHREERRVAIERSLLNDRSPRRS